MRFEIHTLHTNFYYFNQHISLFEDTLKTLNATAANIDRAHRDL